MNAKNIISAILMVLSFAACSSDIEGLDDNMTNTGANNGETSISVRMVTEGVSTKADTQSETLISNYVIAVFEKKSGERVGYASGTANGSYLVTPIVKGIDAKAGIVKVIVVANVDKVNDFDNLYTYDQFSTKTVGNLNNLTKVGIKDDVTLSETENRLDVELKQLTARVNVTLNEPKVSGGNGVTAEFKAYSYSASIAKNSTVISAPQAGETSYVDLNENGETSLSYMTYAVKNPELTVNAKLVISVNGNVRQETKRDIEIEFISKDTGNQLEALIAGESYNQQIDVNVTVTQNFDVSFEYKIVQIKDNENQDITFN